jgi:hypothetical protein
LRLLRGIHSLDIGEVEWHELTSSQSIPQGVIKSHEISSNLKNDLMTTIQGNSPVTHVFKMYQALPEYAQAFGFLQECGSEMTSNYGETKFQRVCEPYAFAIGDEIDDEEVEDGGSWIFIPV